MQTLSNFNIMGQSSYFQDEINAEGLHILKSYVQRYKDFELSEGRQGPHGLHGGVVRRPEPHDARALSVIPEDSGAAKVTRELRHEAQRGGQEAKAAAPSARRMRWRTGCRRCSARTAFL